MKEILVSVIQFSMVSAVFITAFVSDKFKSNIRTISSLSVILVIVSQIGCFDISGIPQFNFERNTDRSETFHAVEDNAETVINNLIAEDLAVKFDVRDVSVSSECKFENDSFKLNKICIEIDTEVPLFNIMDYTEKQFSAYGIVSVVKKSFGGLTLHEYG